MTVCKINNEIYRIGDSSFGDAVLTDEEKDAFIEILVYKNYQNFLRAVNDDTNYFQNPDRVGVPLKPELYEKQQLALNYLLSIEIEYDTVNDFATYLKLFIKNFVLGNTRLLEGLKTGFTSDGRKLYTGCVIRTDPGYIGDYDTQLVYRGTEHVSPTINMHNIIKKVEEERAKEVRAKYVGGSRRSKKSRNRKTRRR